MPATDARGLAHGEGHLNARAFEARYVLAETLVRAFAVDLPVQATGAAGVAVRSAVRVTAAHLARSRCDLLVGLL